MYDCPHLLISTSIRKSGLNLVHQQRSGRGASDEIEAHQTEHVWKGRISPSASTGPPCGLSRHEPLGSLISCERLGSCCSLASEWMNFSPFLRETSFKRETVDLRE